MQCNYDTSEALKRLQVDMCPQSGRMIFCLISQFYFKVTKPDFIFLYLFCIMISFSLLVNI